MKFLNKFAMSTFAVLSLTFLSGCAAGAATAATAGYSIKSQSADALTAEAEQRIVDRTKAEVMLEISRQQCASPNQTMR